MNNRLIVKLMLVSATVLFTHSGLARAEDLKAENEQLKLEVETLKQQIQELQTNRTANCADTKSKKHGKGWDALAVGMSKDEVTSTIGKPGKIDKWNTGEAWYYPNPRGGEVDFDADGKATGWLKP